MSRGMSNALSVAGSAVGGVEQVHNMANKHGKFLSVGSKELMSASVTETADQANAMSRMGPEIAVTIASGTTKLAAQAAITSVKAGLTATGAGAPAAAAVDAAQTVVSKVAGKAMEKMQAGMQQGNSVLRQGTSTPSLSDPLKSMDQEKAKFEAPAQQVKEAVAEVKDVAKTGASLAKGGVEAGSSGPGVESQATPGTEFGPGESKPGVNPMAETVTPGHSRPDPVGVQALGDMRSRAEVDGDLKPAFAPEGWPGRGGLPSIADPITLEQDRFGDPIYMDPSSRKSPLHLVAQEGRQVANEELWRAMNGQRPDKDGFGYSEVDPTRPAVSRLEEIRSETTKAILGAQESVKWQDVDGTGDWGAYKRDLRSAGSAALDEQLLKAGFNPEAVRQQIIEQEVAATSPESANEWRTLLTTEMNDPGSALHSKFYTERGGELIADLKRDQALTASSAILDQGVIPGVPASQARLSLAAEVAAERLGGDVSAIKRDLLSQFEGREAFSAVEAVKRVNTKIDGLPSVSDELKDSMKTRLELLTKAKLTSPEQGQGWQAMGDYLLTGSKGPLADNLTARAIINKAAQVAKQEGKPPL